jgi:hypothetical protein
VGSAVKGKIAGSFGPAFTGTMKKLLPCFSLFLSAFAFSQEISAL